jgi:hypothetical protein
MNFDQIINMILSRLLGRAINGGINAGINAVSKGGKSRGGNVGQPGSSGQGRSGITDDDAILAQQNKDSVRKARQAVRMARRIGKL